MIGMIEQIDNDAVLAMCLLVNDDLHKTFERIKAVKKGARPCQFIPGESVLKTHLNPSHIYTIPEQQQQLSAAAAAQSQDKPQ